MVPKVAITIDGSRESCSHHVSQVESGGTAQMESKHGSSSVSTLQHWMAAVDVASTPQSMAGSSSSCSRPDHQRGGGGSAGGIGGGGGVDAYSRLPTEVTLMVSEMLQLKSVSLPTRKIPAVEPVIGRP